MPKELKFVDNTILTTPHPIHSSSMSNETQFKRKSVIFEDDIPERLSDENSLGLLSINSDDVFPDYRSSNAARHRQKEREKALNLLKNYEKSHGEIATPSRDKSHVNLTSIPSRFLRRSDVSENTGSHLNLSDSTITESDLLPGDYSTPRESLLQEEFMMRERSSIGQHISQFASSMSDPDFKLDDFLKQFRKNMDTTVESSFKSGEEAVAQLEEDEKSWSEKRDIPASFSEISFAPLRDTKLSMGSFFIKKSDDLPDLFARSPEKSENPIPLIEITECTNGRDTINISEIQHILASDQSTTNALNVLMKSKKNRKSKSPVRKSSISSKISDVERCDEALKENVSPEVPYQKSILSSRNSSALSSLPNGKLPIATTKTEIIWGCIKIGKAGSSEFVLRNRSGGKLSIQCTVNNSAFRLNRDGSESNFSSMLKIILHPYESRNLVITFSPTNVGAAVGTLNFTSADPAHQQTVKQFIKLYGYGGFGNVAISKIVKETSGKYLLSLGNMNESLKLIKTFEVRNSGSLPTFVDIDFALNLHLCSNFVVSPQTAVLLPGAEIEVTFSCNMEKKDFFYLKTKQPIASVHEVGKLQITHGTEVDRARLRRVVKKAQEKKIDVPPNTLHLIRQLPNEIIPSDIRQFRESATSMDDVLRLFTNEDLHVTIEQDIDVSATPGEESTGQFHSLCENTVVDALEYTLCKEGVQVDPTRIILTPPDKIKDKICLYNNTKKTQYFETKCMPEGLHLKPADGTIQPGELLMIDLTYVKKINDQTVFKVKILVDNECFDVVVKIIFLRCT